MGDFKKHDGALYWCKLCVTSFHLEHRFKLHQQFCNHADFTDTIFTMPTEGHNMIYVNNYRAKCRQPIVIYADIESVLLPIDERTKQTVRYQQHKAVAIGFKIKTDITTVNFETGYQEIVSDGQEDVVELFLKRMLDLEPMMLAAIFDEQRLVMTDADQAKFDAAEVCHVCGGDFPENDRGQNMRKVRDHCHITGLFRGAAHSICNLQLKNEYKIPIFFHNMRGYDGHFITRAFDRVRPNNRKIEVIGQGLEKYLQVLH